MTYKTTVKLAKGILFAGLVFFSSPTNLAADTFVPPTGVELPGVVHELQWDTTYRELYILLAPTVPTFTAEMFLFEGGANYATILAQAQALVTATNTAFGLSGTAPQSARVVIALPNGTPVIDTGALVNTYVAATGVPLVIPFVNLIGVNQNTFSSVMTALQFPNGVGIESGLNLSTGLFETSLTIRLGPQIDSAGTIRLTIPTPVNAT